jgi:hypothetical protein
MDELRGFTTVLTAFHVAREELHAHVEEVWQSHDFGDNGSTFGPHVYLDATGDGVRLLASFEMATWIEGTDGWSNSVDYELAVQTAGAGLQVESIVQACLDSPGEGLAEGIHELYRKQSVALDLASVCGEIQGHAAALIALNDPLPAVGFPCV